MAEADIELWVAGTQVPCTTTDLANGEPTVLDELTINWGRRGMWDQPDEGSCSFRLHDPRTAGLPLDLIDIVHVGSPFEVFAVGPDTVPAENIISSNFSGESDPLNPDEWLLQSFPASVNRTNRMTDPSMTTTTGKTAGGSAVLASSAAWSQFGTTSISVTPNGVSNASAVFPLGGTGMTAFVAGHTYTISAYIRFTAVQTGTLDANARKIRVHQSTTGGSSVVATSTAAPNVAGVYRLNVTYTVPANATQLVISVCNGSSVAAQVLWVDGVLIEETSTLAAYFDGATTDTTGFTYDWTGAANASTSTESYTATSPSSSVPIVTDPPPHGNIAQLQSNNTHAGFWFPPRDFGSDWFRLIRPMVPGETWTYTADVLANAGVVVVLGARLQRDSTEAENPAAYALVDGGVRTVTGNGSWQTITGTIELPSSEPYGGFMLFGFIRYPGATPYVDNIVVTAPEQAEDRRMIINGRITDVTVQQITGRGSIDLEVTGMGNTAELDNFVIGDEPWTAEPYLNRIRRIVDLIPLTIAATVDYDTLPVPSLAQRDVDAQSILQLLTDLAASYAGVAWPLYHQAVPAHLWIENPENRNPALAATIGIDACKINRDQYQVAQSADQLITLVEMGWMDYDEIEGGYTERAVQVIDDDAVVLYGNRRLSVPSEIATEAGAILVGTDILDRARVSDWAVTGVSVQNDQIDQPALMRLLDGRLRPASLVEVSNLPEWVPGSLSAGWLEGGMILYSNGRWHLDLVLSAADTGS